MNVELSRAEIKAIQNCIRHEMNDKAVEIKMVEAYEGFGREKDKLMKELHDLIPINNKLTQLLD